MRTQILPGEHRARGHQVLTVLEREIEVINNRRRKDVRFVERVALIGYPIIIKPALARPDYCAIGRQSLRAVVDKTERPMVLAPKLLVDPGKELVAVGKCSLRERIGIVGTRRKGPGLLDKIG